MKVKRTIRCIIKRIKRAWRSMPKETRRLVLTALIAALAGGTAGGMIAGGIEKRRARKRVSQAVAALQKEEDSKKPGQTGAGSDSGRAKKEIPWYLTLVNEEHPMKEGYAPELAKVEQDQYVDARIKEATDAMLKDAKAAGMKILICSAYRSVERQKQIFNESLKERLDRGMDYWEAFADNRLSVAEPGKSEHALGLSLDLISNQYTELDEGQENTKEAKWLKENCSRYGFILRYPPEKVDITNIIYEPWHYRYVGVEDAKKITELGLTLEEYLELYY